MSLVRGTGWGKSGRMGLMEAEAGKCDRNADDRRKGRAHQGCSSTHSGDTKTEARHTDAGAGREQQAEPLGSGSSAILPLLLLLGAKMMPLPGSESGGAGPQPEAPRQELNLEPDSRRRHLNSGVRGPGGLVSNGQVLTLYLGP